MTHAETLIKNDWTKADADAKVAQLEAAIKKKFPNATPDFIDKTMKAAITTLTKSKIEQISGICVGFGRKQDSNNYAKMKAKEVWDQDPKLAVGEKYVVTDANGSVVFELDEHGKPRKDGQGNQIPVWADNRQFIDPDTKKMKNGRWGKALGEVIQRDSFFIVDSKFTRVFGNIDVKIGYEYMIYGSMSKKGYISIPKNSPGVKVGKMLTSLEMWTAMEKVYKLDDLSMHLGDVADMEKNKPVATKGTVTRAQQAGSSYMVVISDDSYPDGYMCFAADEGLIEECEALGPGNEIIVIGKTGESTDKETKEVRKNISIYGFAVNPESDKIAGAVRSLDDVLYT
jgi:hypothetical protein